ncbi:MAG: prepilin-type N-terminal cleavage/methylation domain-containing protein [Candidatus Omnitrophica bacterium]|nr:prepilin-type N-terminal cleavage/methylation domain-containing protein [Candidatus Omnitrophota bacterium]
MQIGNLNQKKFRNKNGFTLVELMVVAAIFTGIVLAIFGILSSGRRAWLTSEVQIDVHSFTRQIMNMITTELSESAPGRVTIINFAPNEDRIIFQTPASFSGGVVTWSDQIQFSLGGINGQQFVRTNLATGDTVIKGEHITDLRFNQPSIDLIEIALVLSTQSIIGDTVQMQLDSQVSLRNR